MDLKSFSSLNPLAKLNYIVIKLEHAKGLMSFIYDALGKVNANTVESKGINLNDLSQELESLGDCFVRFGIVTEDGKSEEIFEELQSKINRLEEISETINKLSLN